MGRLELRHMLSLKREFPADLQQCKAMEFKKRKVVDLQCCVLQFGCAAFVDVFSPQSRELFFFGAFNIDLSMPSASKISHSSWSVF